MSGKVTVVTICLVTLLQSRDSFQAGEVEYVNVALGKPTQQTDTVSFSCCSGTSQNAVNGNRDPDYNHGFCTHTASGTNTFWVVDLLHSYTIHHIDITNRDASTSRLTDFYIYVSDINPLPIPPATAGEFVGELCLRHPTALPGAGPHSLECHSNTKTVRGRYVYLWKPQNGALTLCEFEVLVDKSQVQGRWNSVGFSTETGKKLFSAVPFFSLRLEERFSAMGCIAVCMSASFSSSSSSGGSSSSSGAVTGYATIVQMNSATKTCQCIEQSGLGLEGGAGSEVSDGDWILLTSIGNE